MRIRCAWHLQYFDFVLMMGEKEPLDNKETTDGMCPMCHLMVMFEIDVLLIEKETKRLHRAKELM